MIAIILAAVVWIILSFIVGFGPVWPIELLFGQGGCLGIVLSAAWWALLVFGFVS